MINKNKDKVIKLFRLTKQHGQPTNKDSRYKTFSDGFTYYI